MKKICLTFALLLVLSISSFSQCYPDQGDTYWWINESLYGSKKLSGCDNNTYYNCHGFTMSYFEDSGCEKPGWTHPVSTPYTCPNHNGVKFDVEWKNSGRYVQVCTESVANIAYYQLPDGDTHSAVKEILNNGSIKYISKYGTEGPMVEHDLLGSYYHLCGKYTNIPYPQFWSYIGTISGNPNINGIDTCTFSVNNISTVSYSWSVLSGNSNIYIFHHQLTKVR